MNHKFNKEIMFKKRNQRKIQSIKNSIAYITRRIYHCEETMSDLKERSESEENMQRHLKNNKRARTIDLIATK